MWLDDYSNNTIIIMLNLPNIKLVEIETTVYLNRKSKQNTFRLGSIL